ncbi:hypothetical protein EDD85DRAFT_429934 [Armillaria nabsnona]|nr:hypothetical protein EDD85DRAFT_429934 [Armillaria nabsnona]
MGFFLPSCSTDPGGVMMLETILTPQVIADLTKKDLPFFERLVVHLYSNLLPSPSAPVSRQSLAGIIFSCVQAVIENAPISTVVKVEKLLKFCFTVGIGRQSYPLVLDRILTQSAANDPEGNTYLKGVLVTMILHLKSILTNHGISLMEQPCKTFCLTVMQRYTSIIVGKKPPHTIPTALTSFGCGCNYCDDVKTFFTNDVQLTHHLCAVAKVRAHVEEKLKTQRVRMEAAGVEWYTLRTGSPHSLVITKPKSMSLYPAWEINSRRGVELLDEMGDEKTQKVILGEHYLWIHDVLHGGPGTSDPLPIEGLPSSLLVPSGFKRVFDDDIDSEDGSKKKKIKLEE